MKKMKRTNWVIYCMLMPWIIGFLVFKVYPIIISFYYSLLEYPILGDPEFVGLQNYLEIFTKDDTFTASFFATIKYVLIGTPAVIIVSFAVAAILNFKLKGVNFFRTAYYIPSILGGNVAVSILWTMLFDVNGPVNMVLSVFTLGNDVAINWTKDPKFAIFTLIILKTWQFGSTMLIFLSALQGVSKTVYEAAEMDGASKIRQLFNITVPIITPVILFNAVNVLVKAFQEFNSAYLITKGGPNKTTYFLNLYIYDQAFQNGNYGYASALTWILLVIIGIFTVIIFKSSDRWVFYND
ncbi:sugar ABC transporter permease [Enterococcus gallinarum]|uniref:ABC transporter permease subunit n=1 Tax=Enterococcus gallinarum TaxID=1353 RepID=A0A3N3WZP3_ENTGA|nr:sugar ABC transporter permease [Enterococcus sp. FDAARGOS_553]MBO6327195.1 sugar ABC transporter permease [Enterococcus gallinarum]TKL05114.1 sugar ABC transporter permease [Enterococcus sp. ARL09-542]MBO6332300.1 sugar ABC transporter permease [Enterococcus gallinarum]MBO6352823.1 sugar ABC transporter permease [Enterococcus gallinarum]